MHLEEDLTPYNKPFRRSFHRHAFWTVLLYDLVFLIVAALVMKFFSHLIQRKVLSLPDPSYVFTLGAAQAQQQVPIFENFISTLWVLSIVLGLFLLVVWTAMKVRLWAKLLKRAYTFRTVLMMIAFNGVLLALILPAIGWIIYNVQLFAQHILLYALLRNVPVIVAAVVIAVLLILMVFPTLLYLINCLHVFSIEILRGARMRDRLRLYSPQNMYVPHLYMGLAFVATAIVSLIFKVFPPVGEAFLSGVVLILFFAWEKTYLFSLCQRWR